MIVFQGGSVCGLVLLDARWPKNFPWPRPLPLLSLYLSLSLSLPLSLPLPLSLSHCLPLSLSLSLFVALRLGWPGSTVHKPFGHTFGGSQELVEGLTGFLHISVEDETERLRCICTSPFETSWPDATLLVAPLSYFIRRRPAPKTSTPQPKRHMATQGCEVVKSAQLLKSASCWTICEFCRWFTLSCGLWTLVGELRLFSCGWPIVVCDFLARVVSACLECFFRNNSLFYSFPALNTHCAAAWQLLANSFSSTNSRKIQAHTPPSHHRKASGARRGETKPRWNTSCRRVILWQMRW